MAELPSCCQRAQKPKKGDWRAGIGYAILPHTFCILYILFSVIGATSLTFFFKGFLLNKNFFFYLILLSLTFAFLSAAFYLKRQGSLSWEGVKRNRRYLLILFGTMMAVNGLLFRVVFPAAANLSLQKNRSAKTEAVSQSALTLKVAIPCSGHATLITDELKKLSGVSEVKFSLPDLFTVSFNSGQVTEKEILNLEVFKTYSAKVIK